MLFFVFLCAVYCAYAGPTQMSLLQDQILGDVNYKTTLLSIEEKLKNIENSISLQYAITLNGKIDYYGRKIDNIEKQLSRFQVQMRMELEKISENISSKNYRDDITKDRVIRKMDVIYERINHKLGNVEGEIDLSVVKAQNGRDLIVSKLEKIEESLTIRDSDMEAELADAVAAIDDLKTNCNNIEETIKNVTKDTAKMYIKHGEKLIRKYHNQTMAMIDKTNKSSYERYEKIEQQEHILLHKVNNNSNFMLETKEEFNENMNEYANKIINMYTDISSKNNLLHNKIEELGKIANGSKIEQQNALRALTVQVGRKLGKQSENESLIENHTLGELTKNIETKFDSIMLAQNLFFESCHRVQMDEAQLESQISIVLNKLIDIFENKTSVGPKDIHQLEHLIRTHDSNIRRSIHHVTDNLLSLTQQMSTENEEYVNFFKNQKSQLEALDLMLQDLLISGDDSKLMQAILETVQSFQKQLSVSHQEILNALIQVNKNSHKPINTSDVDATMLQSVVDYVKNIHEILGSIETKINKSYLDYYFNRYNVDLVAQRFGTKLKEYLHNLQMQSSTGSKIDLSQAILEIFANNSNNSRGIDGYPYIVNAQNIKNVTIGKLITDIFENSSNSSTNTTNLLCFDATTNTTCETTNETIEKKNVTHNESIDTNCLPYYVDLIEVRFNLDGPNKTNCSVVNSTNEIKNEDIRINNKTEIQQNCTLNYANLIDVRYNPNPDCNTPNSKNLTNSTHLDVKQMQKQSDNCTTDYQDLIDVRSGNAIRKKCSVASEKNVKHELNEEEVRALRQNIFLNTFQNKSQLVSPNTDGELRQKNVFIQNTTHAVNTPNLSVSENRALQQNPFLRYSITIPKSNTAESEALQRNAFLQNYISIPNTNTATTASSNFEIEALKKNIFLAKPTESSNLQEANETNRKAHKDPVKITSSTTTKPGLIL